MNWKRRFRTLAGLLVLAAMIALCISLWQIRHWLGWLGMSGCFAVLAFCYHDAAEKER
jgi:hypothetical protein